MKKPLATLAGPVFVLVVFLGSLWLLHNELRHYHLQDFLKALAAIPTRTFWLAIGLTVFNYVVLVGYDWLAIRYIHHPMKLWRVALASFLGYAVGNNFGTLLGGSTIRFRLYTSWGLSAVEIVKLVFILSATFWIGLFALSSVVFLVDPLIIPNRLHLPVTSTRPLGIALGILALAYLVMCALRRQPVGIWKWEFPLPSATLSVMQYGIATIDLMVAAGVLYVLLPTSMDVSYFHLLSIYLLAIVAALLTQVPGGLGVLELVTLVLLNPSDPHEVVGSLLAYRMIYYLMPLKIGLLVLGGNEIVAHRQRAKTAMRVATKWTQVIAPRLLVFTVFAAGVLLLLSGATPAVHGRMELLRRSLPLPLIELSHFLGSVIGILLIVLARSLQRRIETAYWLTITMLSAGVVFSLLKGIDYEEAIILGVMLTVMIPCRRHFFRKGALFSDRFSPGWFATIGVAFGAAGWLMLFAYKHVEYSDDLWWRFAFDDSAPRSLRASAGAALVAFTYFATRLLSAKRRKPELPTAEELQQARSIVASSPRTSAHLALLGDKYFLFNSEHSAFVMFGIEGRSWVSMGDPVGEREAADQLAWDFREYCEAGGRWPVFYQVDEGRLSVYVEMGLTLLKIGEEARVPLDNFGLEGSARKDLRRTSKKLKEAGCTFEIIPASVTHELLAEFKQISDAWLSEKNAGEKGFSLGFFEPEYIRGCPIAIVRCNGQTIAFANIWQGASQDELSMDLMRYLPDSPHGVMEFLFIELMLWGKQNGYRWFNLGMAPLAGIDAEPLAPLWNQVAAITFRHGEHFYNFEGLRQYKDKFDPVWSPKYIASPGGLMFPLILTNVTTLISGGLHKLLVRR
ncbi:MAG: bifunctional lysylphosphatidylglycerol flippase/synthetase MprF [Planctomycetaceae bacterium]|nr:bifunctional lysylphosphatidylglycerol flippase/synthetase MprF [Planctomycetales bacterium]MCB9924222.1 bifunctional lysylphosphatidylglycerol flippase/synthetase MprF [Planctomycetaceae bacterium]